MQVNPIQAKSATVWFYGAGLVAILFSLFLYLSDEGLSNSTREVTLGNTLRELRTAQSEVGVPSREDPRARLSASESN